MKSAHPIAATPDPALIEKVSNFTAAGTVFEKDTSYKYYCREGYGLDGNANSQVTYTCEKTGLWDRQPSSSSATGPGTCSGKTLKGRT